MFRDVLVFQKRVEYLRYQTDIYSTSDGKDGGLLNPYTGCIGLGMLGNGLFLMVSSSISQ